MAEYCGEPLQKIESAVIRTVLLRVHNYLHRLWATAQLALRMDLISYEADVHRVAHASRRLSVAVATPHRLCSSH
jgi:hypothetical protein